MAQQDTSSASGYIVSENESESYNYSFTEVTVIKISQLNVIAKGKRYGRWWLLKALKKELSGQIIYQKWLHKEFDLMVQLQHPNIVNTIGLEDVEGLGECIIMEFIDGVNLQEWLQSNPVLSNKKKVAYELTEAVSYIHSKNIVHRDLKPSNILITRNGSNLKLIDFGLSDSDDYAIFKQPAGTARYMSPEQKAQPQADVRNDIYSIGKILNLFRLGHEYDKIISKCLEESNRRYNNIHELQEAISAVNTKRPTNIFLTFTIIFIILSSIIAYQFNKVSKMNRSSEIEKSERTDLHKTVRNLKDSLKQANESYTKEILKLNNSLSTVKTENKQLKSIEDQFENHKKLMEETITKGIKEIDYLFIGSGFIKRIATSQCSLEDAYQEYSDICRFPLKFASSLDSRYSHSDRAIIQNALGMRLAKYANDFIEATKKNVQARNTSSQTHNRD